MNFSEVLTKELRIWALLNLLLLAFLGGGAQSSAQTTRPADVLETPITFSIEGGSLRGVIMQVAQLAGIKAIFEDELLDIGGVRFSGINVPLRSVLDSLLGTREITYTISRANELIISKSPQAAEKRGSLEGTVQSTTGEPLVGATVMIKGTRLGTASDSKGTFVLRDLKPGSYAVEVSFIGYTSEIRPGVLDGGKSTELNFTLTSALYYIGGIEVVADQNVLPRDPETKNEIRSGQIEHLQASSLRDVLQLVPGIKTTNPDLGSVQQANLRGSEVDVAGKNVGSFGTQIIVDNVPTSNNANMQINGGTASTAGSGIDLRSVPTENVESIEVIRGIPSARYGDMASGLVRVTTKLGRLPNRLKFKYNPNTYEGNLSGGANLWQTGIGYNINMASSARDIRRPGDGYARIALQLSTLNDLLEENSLTLKNIFYFTRAFDEVKEDASYAARTASYDRDLNGKYTLDAKYKLDAQTTFKAIGSAAYTYQNSWRQEVVSRDNLVLSDLQTNGSKEGYFALGSYLSQYWVKGDVWNFYGNVEAEKRFFIGDIIHTISSGLNIQYDVNRGQGRVYDPLFPPPSTVNQGDRPRRYDELPGITTAGFFAEDKISGDLGIPFTLQAGFRYQMFNPQKLHVAGMFTDADFVESRQGSFFDPRISLSLNVLEDTQFRFGYGKTSKSPPMALIYPNPKYYDVVDTVAISPQDPSRNFSIISTYVYDRGNVQLKGYSQTKYEASIDQRLFGVGLSFTGFMNETRGGFSSSYIPVTFFKKSWTNWPDRNAYFIRDTVMDKITVSRNTIFTTTKGVEGTLKTRRLPVINTIIEFDAAYSYYEAGEENGVSYGGLRYDPNLGTSVYPITHQSVRYSKDLLLKYRFDILLEALHVWITLNVEQQALEIDGYKGREDSLAIGYYSMKGETVMIPEDQRANPIYGNLRNTPQPYELLAEEKPNKWLVNLRVSKEVWTGTEISFFVNNFLNDRPLYRSVRTDANTFSYERRNPPLYFGLEISSVVDTFFGGRSR